MLAIACSCIVPALLPISCPAEIDQVGVQPDLACARLGGGEGARMFSSGIPVGPGASEMVLEELTTDGGLAVVGGRVGAMSLLGGLVLGGLVVGHIRWLSIKHDVVILLKAHSSRHSI